MQAQALEAIPLPALIIAEDDGMLLANSAFKSLFPMVEFGRTYLSLLRHPALDKLVSDTRAGQKGGSAELHVRIGIEQVFRATCALLPDRSLLLCLQDTSETAAAVQTRRDFIADLSHELRTPLNGVIGFADILQKESYGPLGVPEYKEYCESIYVSGRRLLSVVNDMLYIAKLDADEFELSKTEVAIDELIENSICKFEEQAEAEQKSLSMDIPRGLPSAEVDLSVVKEIIAHLLSNAFKYTQKAGKIVVRAVQSERDLIIEVEDTGCGVDPENLPRLTEAFYQADASLNRQYEGAGLGLYVVSKFVDLHGGALVFESPPEGGFLACVLLKEVIIDKREEVAA